MDQPYVRLSSAGMGVLYDPSVSRTETTLGVASAPDLNWVELGKRLNASEINFATLKSNIEAAIKIQSPITLGQILKMFPPKHGLATIVGYLHLAVEKAERKDDVKEIIDWENRWKEKTAASIPTFIFSLSNLDEEGKLL